MYAVSSLTIPNATIHQTIMLSEKEMYTNSYQYPSVEELTSLDPFELKLILVIVLA